MYFGEFSLKLLGVWLFCLGAVLTSGIMCLAARLRSGESWVKGRSHCDNCSHNLTVIELVPIVGAFINKGTCKHCGYKYGYEYAASELMAGLCFGGIVYMPAMLILCVILEIIVFFRVYTA